MRFDFIKSTAIHPILFTVFPILLLITSNLDEVVLIDAGFSFLIVMVVMFTSWFFLNIFFKNKLRSGLFVSLGLVLFFSYDHFLRMTTQIDVSALPFSHHTYGIPVFFIMLILGIFAIIKIKKHLMDVTTFTNAIAIVLVVMLLPNIVSYSFETQSVEPIVNPLNYRITHESELKDKPNIYYIILDEYTSDEILTKIYDYDNQDFLSKLVDFIFHQKAIPTIQLLVLQFQLT